ncbi:MAG TPA: GTP-binding protein [Limnobacter sp.]|uniref:GTP-binding protein n=1 Tax=Limnobacter sp. TaxID=2003368 RepID=UPI002E3689EC|nr:GTP-binding protein [Limnobacter sp.]HEX5485648.1 GTP-binding protein [Limnobacter sp.]
MATRLILIHHTNMILRAAHLKQCLEQQLHQSQKITVFASGEVFSIVEPDLQAQLLKDEQHYRGLGVHWLRMAPGCACCSSRLVIQTHLGRTLRLNPPDVLILEVDSGGHVDTLMQWLSTDQWQHWFSSIEVFTPKQA